MQALKSGSFPFNSAKLICYYAKEQGLNVHIQLLNPDNTLGVWLKSSDFNAPTLEVLPASILTLIDGILYIGTPSVEKDSTSTSRKRKKSPASSAEEDRPSKRKSLGPSKDIVEEDSISEEESESELMSEDDDDDHDDDDVIGAASVNSRSTRVSSNKAAFLRPLSQREAAAAANQKLSDIAGVAYLDPSDPRDSSWSLAGRPKK